MKSHRIDGIDLCDLDRWAVGVPFDQLKRLRQEAPVYWHEETNGSGFWAITKYTDIRQISKSPLVFSSARGGTNIFDMPKEELDRTRAIMLNMDPPDHTKYRRLVSQGFTPRIVNKLEGHIRDISRTIIDNVVDRGECDFVTDIAAELPLQVIAEMVGIPIEERHLVFDWSNRLIGFDDPEFQTSMEDGKMAAMEMWAYAHGLAEKRRAQPTEDLVSVLMHAEVDGEKLTEMEFDAFFILLAVAGNETTRNLISGGMLALVEHPDQRARLLRDPSLLPTGVEEMLRWVCPLNSFRRTANCDTDLRGVKIAEGDKVVMFYPSANRDEEIFPNPETFDVGRTPNEHLAFGIGEHFCLGANLARMEIRIMFEEILRRLPDIELNGPVSRLRSNFINGIKHMPVRFSPEQSRRAATA